MADNERNTPIQDPENLENNNTSAQVPMDENAKAEEPATEPMPEAAEPVAEEAVEEASEPAEIPEDTAPQPVADEAAEGVAKEVAEPTEEYAEQTALEPIEDASDVAVEITEESPEGASEEVAEEPLEEETSENDASEETVDETAEPAEEPEVTEADEADGYQEDLDGRFELGVGDDGEIYLVQNGKRHSSSDKSDEDYFGEDFEDDEDEEEEEEYVDPEDLVIYDEVIEAIKAEGAKLTNSEPALRNYFRHSREAILNFESALKTGQRAFESNTDDKEAPVLLVGIIKICGKILEVKCNNLENFVRVKAHNYINGSKESLHNEVERYNDLVINYASITGEQLTRLSTFLPENIASGKSLAVVPELTYAESYVKILPGELNGREEEVTTMPIVPAVTADGLLADIKPPRGKITSYFYSRKVKRAMKKLISERAKLAKLSAETKALRKKYESELENLERRTTLAKRATDEYKNQVFEINIKYGKQLSGIETVKAKSAFARARQSLKASRMALERERIILAYEHMRAIKRAGSYSQRKAAERMFSDAITSYNQIAEITSKATGAQFEKLTPSLFERALRGDEIVFPMVAYKRQLVERVGEQRRIISMVLAEDISPNEELYNESSAKILDKQKKIKNTATLSDEAAMEDRASAIAKVMIESLRESADGIVNAGDFKRFEKKCHRALRYFKRAKLATDYSMARAFDENGVITALVENLRAIANIIEVRRIIISTAVKFKRTETARFQGRLLYKNIELYNGRAIDYMSIVGEQFSRITTATSKVLVESADKIKVPIITYKDNYIEVFPKDPLQDPIYEKPRLFRKGVYTPLLMQHYRLTENRAVETTVVNAPFVFDVTTDDLPAVSWWHPIGIWDHAIVILQPIRAWWSRVYTNAEIWFVDESLLFSKSGLKGRQSKNEKRKKRFERKLKRLNDWRDAQILGLETVVHESDRHGASYQKKLYSINKKFSRKAYRLKVRYMRAAGGQNATRLLLERLVLERERLAGINKVLLKYRNYGRITFTPNVLKRYKRKFIDAITEHNKTAAKLSEILGIQFSQVSTSVADEIIRYGKIIKFPQIVCCREVIENVDGTQRTVGDRWHGYGLYTGTSGSAAANGAAPIMSVGAMGYATDMGVPFLKADFDGMTMMGMTPGGVPLIGFSQSGETSIPFTGTPMMLAGADGSIILDAGKYGQDSLIIGAANVKDPYSGINSRGVDANYTREAEEDAKDVHSGITTETPLNLEVKMIEERFSRSLRARNMTTFDSVFNWWRLLISEWNFCLMRFFLFRKHGFLRFLLPRRDAFLELVNKKFDSKKRDDAQSLRQIARLGSLIDIECRKLYAASKTGVRRSQRAWSRWLHEDIQQYNLYVKGFNSRHERYMHLELLSLNMPDTIRFRTEDRPPVPPVYAFRNRVKIDDKAAPIASDEIYDVLVKYAMKSATRYANPIRWLWTKIVTIPLIWIFDKLHCRGIVLFLVTGVIKRRAKRTNARRISNEVRHYHIRYEKARAMKRYNRRTLRSIGVANKPITYQFKLYRALRAYLKTNFRIDYNMRIRQLIYRALSIDTGLYWGVLISLLFIAVCTALADPVSGTFQVMMAIAVCWACIPIALLLLRIIYIIVMAIVALVLLVTRNILLIKYGTRDVERNRYGIILDCFVTEQYRLLLACEKLRRKRNSFTQKAKKFLIASVNDYNKRAEVYSETLRVPIKKIETTALIETLLADGSNKLYELQNFTYVREIVERVDIHERGKTMNDRELSALVDEINGIINGINLQGSDNQVGVDFLQGAMQRLISYIQTDIKPTQNDRFELKRDLVQAISQFNLNPGDKELFIKDVILIVDQLGGKDSRRIIGVLEEDNMII